MRDVIDRILVSEEEIVKRSSELGKQISDDYRKTNETPLVVALLKMYPVIREQNLSEIFVLIRI